MQQYQSENKNNGDTHAYPNMNCTQIVSKSDKDQFNIVSKTYQGESSSASATVNNTAVKKKISKSSNKFESTRGQI